MRLSPKKNGKGYVTSYSLNIGCAEARRAGLVDENGNLLELEKYVDEPNKEIIIKVKKQGV